MAADVPSSHLHARSATPCATLFLFARSPRRPHVAPSTSATYTPLHSALSSRPARPRFLATDPPPVLPRVHTDAAPPSCVLPCSSCPSSTSPSRPPCMPGSLRIYSALPHALLCAFCPASTRACSALSSPSPYARPDAPLARVLPALPPCTPVPDSWAVPPCTRLCTGTPVQPCAVRTTAAPPSCALPCLFCSASSGAHLYAPACMWARLSRYTSILGILNYSHRRRDPC
jgi:hypothetical protein